jgi:hypothetical protein
MPVLTEGNHIGDVLVNEFDQSYNRERFVAEGDLVIGQVVKNGTGGTQKAPTVAAGTSANAVALNNAKSGEPVICLVRGPAIVKNSGVVYTAGATDNEKAATRVLLLALGIKVTTQVV